LIKIDHRIAGILFRTESDIPIQGLKSTRLNRFQVEAQNPDIHHRYCHIPADTLSVPPLEQGDLKDLNVCMCCSEAEFRSHTIFRSSVFRHHLNDCMARINNITLEVWPSSVVLFDFLKKELYVYYSHSISNDILNFRLGPSLFAPFLTLFSAVMLHSSALIQNGKTAIFLAPDEGGKTTVVKQSPKGTILCDDQVVIKKEKSEFIAYGTPWGVYTSCAESARVGGFFLLEQAEAFELIKLNKESALEYMWNEHISYRFFLPRQVRVQFFDLIYALCSSVPIYRMRFPKDYIDWNAIKSALE
jgi:hypothetical protein